MTPAQETHAETMREAVRVHCPEVIPFLKDLGRNELIEGWRNVVAVLDVGPPRPLNAVSMQAYYPATVSP